MISGKSNTTRRFSIDNLKNGVAHIRFHFRILSRNRNNNDRLLFSVRIKGKKKDEQLLRTTCKAMLMQRECWQQWNSQLLVLLDAYSKIANSIKQIIVMIII